MHWAPTSALKSRGPNGQNIHLLPNLGPIFPAIFELLNCPAPVHCGSFVILFGALAIIVSLTFPLAEVCRSDGFVVPSHKRRPPQGRFEFTVAQRPWRKWECAVNTNVVWKNLQKCVSTDEHRTFPQGLCLPALAVSCIPSTGFQHPSIRGDPLDSFPSFGNP